MTENPAELLLEGRSITLRPFKASDVHEAYLDWLADPIVNQFSQRLGAKRPTAVEAKQYLENLHADEVVLGIHMNDGRHVGNIKYGPVDWRNMRADISILIGEKSVWGQGIGSEAIYLVTKYLFEEAHLNRVDAGSNNPAFIKTVQKIGWCEEGVLKQRIATPTGFRDHTLLAQLAQDFEVRPEFQPS